MSKTSKAYREAAEKVDRDKLYTPLEAAKLAKETSSKKQDATVEVAIRLGVDPRKADQLVRGTVNLPHGTGKTARVAVFAVGDKAAEAEAAGADVVGSDGLVGLVTGGEDDHTRGLAGAVRQVHRAAHHLVRLAGVHAKTDGDLDGRVLLALGGLPRELRRLERRVQPVSVDLLRGLAVCLAALCHV